MDLRNITELIALFSAVGAVFKGLSLTNTSKIEELFFTEEKKLMKYCLILILLSLLISYVLTYLFWLIFDSGVFILEYYMEMFLVLFGFLLIILSGVRSVIQLFLERKYYFEEESKIFYVIKKTNDNMLLAQYINEKPVYRFVSQEDVLKKDIKEEVINKFPSFLQKLGVKRNVESREIKN